MKKLFVLFLLISSCTYHEYKCKVIDKFYTPSNVGYTYEGKPIYSFEEYNLQLSSNNYNGITSVPDSIFYKVKISDSLYITANTIIKNTIKIK